MLPSVRRLVIATDGAALVEMALIAPLMAAVMMGTVDTAQYFASGLNVQQAVNRSLEMSLMGGPTVAVSDIQAQAADQAGVDVSAVTVTQTLKCSGAVTAWALTCASGQETARYTQVSVWKTFTPSFVLNSLTQMYKSSNGDIPISVTGTVRIQ